MRTPQDIPARAPKKRGGRGRWWILGAIVVLVILLASLKSLATLYTDSLWFSSVGQHPVWSTLLAVKVGLFASFGAIFFVGLWANLLICDRLGARHETLEPEDELVRRYQRVVRPYAGRVYGAIALVIALIAASGTVGEWNNWILFTHAQSFGVKDPQFGMDVGFFVFRLPFLNFLVNWVLIALVVMLVVTAVFHYLNGGIRVQRTTPRVRPAVKAHLSVLLALIALVKAGGYVLARYQLDVSSNGYVQGVGYTDAHARLPALAVLFFVSLFAAAILLYNIRQQGWTLPVLAVGVWAFVALVIGVIYPAVLQALKVNPAQSTLEQPYIQRNIDATRAAFGLQHVVTTPGFQGSNSLSANDVQNNQTTLSNIRLWDPDPSISLPTFQKRQDTRSYYTFQSVGVDRYNIGGALQPAIVGVRQINPDDLPSSGWVNSHLQYTHGEGMVLAQANQGTSNGNPVFGIYNVPPFSNPGLPKIKQAGVYFGENDPGYVIANTRQPELNYEVGQGNNVEGHYQGPNATGGVRLSNFLTKMAFFIRLGDFNLLISNLITPQSRIMFVRDIQAMAQKAAPFLSYDADPYAAVVNGHIDWIIDAYVTTSQYPYSQNASSEQVPPGSGLPGNYNYVRNAVKVVIDAYSGQMTFYAMDNDPILRAYEAAFPHMFTPAKQMPADLQSHLRYPEDLFSVQAATYGRYHITSASNFYNGGDAWNLSPTAGVGAPSNALAVTVTTNSQGQPTGGSYTRMSPLYQVLQEPGQKGQNFTISDVYVPASQGASIQNMTAFMMAGSDPGEYGKLRVYITTPGQSVTGPALADSEIQQNAKVSQTLTLLDQHGSQVVLGNILMVPIDQAVLYVRPVYIESSGNPQPQLKYVITVLGEKVGIEPTLQAALSDVLQTPVSVPSTPSTPGTVPPSAPQSADVQTAQAALKQAAALYQAAQAALKNGDLQTFAQDIQAENAFLLQAQNALNTPTSSTTTVPTSSTTTTAPHTTTTTAPGSGKGPKSTGTAPEARIGSSQPIATGGTPATTTRPSNEA